LHDFSGITGGCLNPGDCTKYEGGCGACPQVGRWPLRLPLDTTRRGYRRNVRLAATGRVTAVAPSQFLAAAARRGAWGSAPLVVIPNPVDTATFHPALRESALERLAKGRSVVLMVASDLDHPRKGLPDLLEAWPSIRSDYPDAELWLVGRCTEMAPAARALGPSVSVLGTLDSASEIAERYAAASLTVVPSHEDNAPCTVSESQACGTPVVGFPTGGIPDMIVDGVTGSICGEASASALGVAVRRVLGSLMGADVRASAAAHARDRWSHERVARAHVDLYRERVASVARSAP
jgi:glycosyltransferase involved in cell wall biosynthesis